MYDSEFVLRPDYDYLTLLIPPWYLDLDKFDGCFNIDFLDAVEGRFYLNNWAVSF